MTPALAIEGLSKRFGGLPATKNVSLTVMPGERRLIIGPNGAGKTTLFNLITGDLFADAGSVKLFGTELAGMPTEKRVHLGLARTYQILTLFPRETLLHNVKLALLGLDKARWNPVSALSRRTSMDKLAQAALDRVGLGDSRNGWSPKPPMANGGGWNSPWPARRSRSCCFSTSRSPASPRRNARP